MRYRLSVIAALAAVAAEPSGAAWTRAWMAAPLQFPDVPPPGPRNSPPRPLVSGTDGTFRMSTVLSAGGRRLRLRFSNELGPTPVRFDRVEVASFDAAGRIVPGSARKVTFGGAPQGVIAGRSAIESDPVQLKTRPGARLAVSVHVPGDAATVAMHPLEGATTFVAGGAGQGSHEPESAPRRVEGSVLLTAVDVDGAASQTIVALGDSITDGCEGGRWTDVVAAKSAGRIAVANAGISGNRLLSMGTGQAALVRLDRDVLSVPGVRYLVLLEGINDIGGAVRDGHPPPEPSAIIAAYRRIVDRAHARGISVIGGTLLPYRGAFFYSPEGDAVRRSVNSWIRTAGKFDQVVDFERALADPADPGRLAPAFDSGDHLHPNSAGMQRMGEEVVPYLFP